MLDAPGGFSLPRSTFMEDSLSLWLNIATILMMLGFITYLSLLPYTTFFGDDE